MLWCILLEAIQLTSTFGALDHICFSLMLMHSEDALFAEKKHLPHEVKYHGKSVCGNSDRKNLENPQKLWVRSKKHLPSETVSWKYLTEAKAT